MHFKLKLIRLQLAKHGYKHKLESSQFIPFAPIQQAILLTPFIPGVGVSASLQQQLRHL